MRLSFPTENLPVSEPSSPDDRLAFHHVPVLLDEVLQALQPGPGRIFLDGTLGGGGHAAALLGAGAQVIGLDQDDDALAAAGQRLSRFGDAFHPLKANFREMQVVLRELEVATVDGILLDLGVSSHQLDQPSRGFSFQNPGPLDMRMDGCGGPTAADLVNTAPVEELRRIFREYGEEPQAGRIAARLVARRTEKCFTDTLDLAETVAEVSPRRGRRHPATQVFQALRMAVNDELGALQAALRQAPDLLGAGGRFAVISFHSLEDRLVKNDFRERSQEWLDRPEWPAPQANPACLYRAISRKSITASPAELTNNPRARSARLRVVEKRKNPS